MHFLNQIDKQIQSLGRQRGIIWRIPAVCGEYRWGLYYRLSKITSFINLSYSSSGTSMQSTSV